jgi:hypothetical protein
MEGEKEVTVVRVKGRLQLRYEGKKCDDAEEAYDILDRLLGVWGAVLLYRMAGGEEYPVLRIEEFHVDCARGRWADVAAHFTEIERLFMLRGRPVVHKILSYIWAARANGVEVQMCSAVDWMWENELSAMEQVALVGVTNRLVKAWRRWAVIELGLWEPARYEKKLN